MGTRVLANALNDRPLSEGVGQAGVAGFAVGASFGVAAPEATAAYFGRAGAGLLAGTGAAQAGGVGYVTFDAFKRVAGRAGDGLHWHHIVEQTPTNVVRFGAQAVHNTRNLVRVAAGVHAKISGYYSSKQPFTNGQTVRQWLSGQSYEEQMRFGGQVLEAFGGK